MKNWNRNTLSAAVLAAMTVNGASVTHANTESSLVLEEVVVTAERRSQSLQEIPLAVSAVSGDTIEKTLITRTEDLATAAPGLQISKSRLGGQRLVIRGIGGSLRDNIAASPKVAFFVDDVYVARSSAMDMAFFDLDRVEVLRGPQGTLYGKNAIAGAVNVHSKAPSDEFESKVSFNAGNYNQRQTRFMIGGPLADSVFGKILAGSNERDGFSKNIFTGNDLSLEESYFGRATLVFEGEDWDVRATMDYEDNPSNPGTALHINGSTGFDVINLGGALGTAVFSPNDVYEVALDEDGESSQTTQGFSLKASHSGDNIAFDSITGYRENQNSFIRDIDNSPSNIVFPDVSPLLGAPGPIPSTISVINSADDDSWSVSQEFRISSVENGDYTLDGSLFWTAGLYLFRDEGERNEDFHAFIPGAGLDQLQKQSLELEGDTVALYGQGTYSISEDLDIVFGLRYSRETKEAIHNSADGLIGILVGEDYSDIKIDESWTQLTPKITANYQINDDLMVYGTFSKGSLGGGFNFGPFTAADAATLSFDQEEADNVEVGIKGTTFNNRLQYSLSAFFIDYQDLQVQTISPAGTTTTDNAGTATSQGIELEATALVTESLTLSTNYAYVDATFDEYCQDAVTDNNLKGAACAADGGIDTSGNRLEYSSEHVFNLSAQYIIPLQEKGDLVLSTSYAYTSEQFFGPDNTAGQDGYELVNASIAFESADEHWYLSLWGKNLTEEEYNKDFISYGKTSDGAAYVQGAPRTYGATVTWTY